MLHNLNRNDLLLDFEALLWMHIAKSKSTNMIESLIIDYAKKLRRSISPLRPDSSPPDPDYYRTNMQPELKIMIPAFMDHSFLLIGSNKKVYPEISC
jgi:hypothetical protein